MRKKLAAVFAVLVLAACAAGAPREEPEPLMPQPWVNPPRVYSLIGERDRLELTSGQVEVLDSIGVALAEENRPLAERAQELQGQSRRGITRETAEVLRPVLTQIRDNNQRAMERVREILTDEQERTVCRIAAAERTDLTPEQRRRQERQEREEQQERRRRGMGMDTPAAAARSGVWPWCAPAPMRGDTVVADTTVSRP